MKRMEREGGKSGERLLSQLTWPAGRMHAGLKWSLAAPIFSCDNLMLVRPDNGW